MISELWKITKTLVTLADDLQKYHSEIKEIRTELRNLTIAVSLLKQRIEHNEEMSETEQKNLLLECREEAGICCPVIARQENFKAAWEEG